MKGYGRNKGREMEVHSCACCLLAHQWPRRTELRRCHHHRLPELLLPYPHLGPNRLWACTVMGTI